MLSSSSSDSFTPNKKKKKPDTITNWSVFLKDDKLIITGLDKTRKRHLKKTCQFRVSNYIFYDTNGTVYSLLGYSINNKDLPKYIHNKFKTGIPPDWNNVIKIWKQYKQLGKPDNFQWETNYFSDCTDNESNDKNETIKALEKKVEEYNKRLRILRRSLLCSNVSSSSIRNKQQFFYTTEDNSKYSEIQEQMSSFCKSNNIFSRNNNTEIVSYHEQNPEQNLSTSNSVKSEQINNVSSSESQSLHLFKSFDTSKYKLNTKKTDNSDIFPEIASIGNKIPNTIQLNNSSSVIKEHAQNVRVNNLLKNDFLKQIKNGSKYKKSTNTSTDQIDIAQKPTTKINTTLNVSETNSSKKHHKKVDSKISESIPIDHKILQTKSHKLQSTLLEELPAPVDTSMKTNTFESFLKPANIVTEKKNKSKASETKRKKYDKQSNLTTPNHSIIENSNMSTVSSSVVTDSSFVSNISISSRGRRRCPVLPYWLGSSLKVCDNNISIQVTSKSYNLESYISENSNLSLLTTSKLNYSNANRTHSKLPEGTTSPFKKVVSRESTNSNKKDINQSIDEVNESLIQKRNNTVLNKSLEKKQQNINTDIIKSSTLNKSKQNKSIKNIKHDLYMSMSDDFSESSKISSSEQSSIRKSPTKRKNLISKNKKSLTKETSGVHINKHNNNLDEVKSGEKGLRKRKSASKLTTDEHEVTKDQSTPIAFETSQNITSKDSKLNSESVVILEKIDEVSLLENTSAINSPLTKRIKSLQKSTNTPENTVSTPVMTRSATKKMNYKIDISDGNITQNYNSAVSTNTPIRKTTKHANLIEFSESSSISKYHSPKLKTRSAQNNIKSNENQVDENKNQFKSTQSTRKKITNNTSKIIEVNDKDLTKNGLNKIKSPLKTSKSNVQNLLNESAKLSPIRAKSDSKLSSKQLKNVNDSVEVNRNINRLHRNVSVNLFTADITNTRRQSSRHRAPVDYSEKLFVSLEKLDEISTPRAKTTNTSPSTKTMTKSKDNHLKKKKTLTNNLNVGPKQTVIFKAPKPKKNQLILPVDPNKLYQNLFEIKSNSCNKRVLDTRKPVQNISLNNKAKSRKLFQNNAWVQSNEFSDFICGGISETEENKPSFVLKFNPESLYSELEEDKFSDVSGITSGSAFKKRKIQLENIYFRKK